MWMTTAMMSSAVAAHAGVPAESEISAQATTMTRPVSIVPEMSQCGAVVAPISQSGRATVSTLNWMAITPSRTVS
ncbi:hypothetical protein [Streptomyces hokutonensis]|uniref:hypothetical protein n=1 Tax=Streptomyces hokutonensis TaxID=1306990 RepID=UPI0033FE4E95